MSNHELSNSQLTSHILQEHDWMEIGAQPDALTAELPPIMGQQTIAKIGVGEAIETADSQPQGLYILKIRDQDNDDYQDLLGRAEAEHVVPGRYVIAAMGARPDNRRSISAMAFLSDRSRDVVGSAGTLKWFTFGVVREGEAARTPFAGNPSVDGQQFLIKGSDLGLSIIGLSSTSRTEILAPDLKIVLRTYDAANTEIPRKRSRAAKVASHLLGRGLTAKH